MVGKQTKTTVVLVKSRHGLKQGQDMPPSMISKHFMHCRTTCLISPTESHVISRHFE